MSNETRRSPVEGEQMSHEEGIEAAAEWIERHADTTDSPYVIAKAIIASYLAEAGLVRLDEAVEAVETMYAESNGPNWDFGYNTARAQSAQALRALTAAQPTSEGEEREAFEAVMRLHFKLPDATFDWAEDVPWMTDPNNTNGDIIDCDDFWIGWQARASREGGKR